MVKKKKTEEYVEIRGAYGEAKDYHIYHMKRKDYLVAGMLGFLLAFIVLYAFFGNVFVSVIGGIISMTKAPKYYRGFLQKKQMKELRIQFKDLLESLSSSYSAGLNTVDAFTDAVRDMEAIYGADADICRETKLICEGLKNNINVEELLLDFAKRSGLEDVMSFADVFEICNRQGSDLKRIVADTRQIINDKIEVEMEIETMLAGNKNELNIMIVMPVIIVVMLKGIGAGTASENNFSTILIKVICMAIFAAAYTLGRKIVDIKI